MPKRCSRRRPPVEHVSPRAQGRQRAAHSRFGVDVAHEARSELVGRERELGIVRDAFERARHERTPQLLALVGVPGIGKSRLVYELQRIVDADPELITWRQGRCLAYGDGITLWALGEIVKAQAGVLEQDSPEEIAVKVHQVVDDTLAGTGDEARVEAHLLALLGLASEAQLGGDRRNEAFAAAIVNNLAVVALYTGDFPRTDELYAEAERLAERYGDASSVRFIRGNRVWLDFMLGRWERALESADAFIAECEAGSPHRQESTVREVRAALSIARGDDNRALLDQLRAFELTPARQDPFRLLGALAGTAALYAECGQLDEARSLAVQIPPLVCEVGLHGALTRVAVFADELGIGDDLRDAVAAGAGPAVPRWRSTIELVLAGDVSAAADVMASAGNPTIEANLSRHAGLRFAADGRPAQAEVELQRALDFYRSVNASFYITQIEEALAGAQSASA